MHRGYLGYRKGGTGTPPVPKATNPCIFLPQNRKQN